MGYVPYTGSKDYFEEPLTGGDLVLRFTIPSSTVTCISETDIGRLGLVAPSSRIGVAYGKPLDIIKIFVRVNSLNGDTASLLTGGNGVISIMSGNFATTMQKQYGVLGIALPAVYAGKVLRVDYIPDSTASAPSAVVTMALYV